MYDKYEFRSVQIKNADVIFNNTKIYVQRNNVKRGKGMKKYDVAAFVWPSSTGDEERTADMFGKEVWASGRR